MSAITQRNAKAFRLREQGATYQAIGQELGVTAAMASLHVFRTARLLMAGLQMPDGQPAVVDAKMQKRIAAFDEKWRRRSTGLSL